MDREHGDYSIEARDRYLILRFTGATNEVTFKRFVSEYQQAVGEFPQDKPWGIVLDMRDWDLHTSDISEDINRLYQWNVAHGERYSARIINDSKFQKKVIEQMHNGVRGFLKGYFNDEDEAVRWMECRLRDMPH